MSRKTGFHFRPQTRIRKRGMAASQEISRLRDRKDPSIPKAAADSLGAIMDAEGSGLRAVTGSLAGLDVPAVIHDVAASSMIPSDCTASNRVIVSPR